MPSSPLRSSLQLIGTFLFLVLVVNLSVIREVIYQNNTPLYDEGGLVETLTAAAFVTGAVFLFATSFFRRGLAKFLTVLLATVNLTGFLREVDVAEYNVPSPISELASNDLKDTLLALFALGLLFIAIRKYRKKVKVVIQTFWNPTGVMLVLGVLIFLVSSVFEQTHHNFAEELLEANAAMAFLCGSLLFAVHEPKPLSEELRASESTP